MARELMTSLRLTALSLLVCCIGYPAILLAFSQTAFPENAEGSLIRDERGIVIGSRLICQDFTRPEYFWPRPSAVNYNAAAAGGSNLSPTNPAIRERAEGIIQRLNLSADDLVPPDLLAASGSGLDPHISRAAAKAQAARIAEARGLPTPEIQGLIEAYLAESGWTAPGEPIVNVLELNLVLDEKATR